MQQPTINFTAQQVDVRVGLAERVRTVHRVVNAWLDGKSEFYSRLAEFAVTRRAAIRIGIVLPLLMVVAAIAVEQAPVVSLLSASVSGWMVYRLNKGGKGGKA